MVRGNQASSKFTNRLGPMRHPNILHLRPLPQQIAHIPPHAARAHHTRERRLAVSILYTAVRTSTAPAYQIGTETGERKLVFRNDGIISRAKGTDHAFFLQLPSTQ